MPDQTPAVPVEVTEDDNRCTVELTEWLAMADLFDEDNPDSFRVMERFGDFADQLFARHRLAHSPSPPSVPRVPTAEMIEAAAEVEHPPYRDFGICFSAEWTAAWDRAALTAVPAGDAGEDERAKVIAWLREQSDKGADVAIAMNKGSTARAAYGGGSYALKLAADEIEQGAHTLAAPEVVCEPCGKPILRGQFVHCYTDVGEVHVDCEHPNAFSDDPEAVVLVGDPLVRERILRQPPLPADVAALVERLRGVTEGSMYDEPATTFALCQDAADLIERLSPAVADRGDVGERARELLRGELIAADMPICAKSVMKDNPDALAILPSVALRAIERALSPAGRDQGVEAAAKDLLAATDNHARDIAEPVFLAEREALRRALKPGMEEK